MPNSPIRMSVSEIPVLSTVLLVVYVFVTVVVVLFSGVMIVSPDT